MNNATRLYSFSGLLKENIEAGNIKSPSDARKLGPFVDEDKLPLTWINWSKPKGKSQKKTRPYFRHYPKGEVSKGRFKTINEELEERKKFAESDLHKKAKETIFEYLAQQIAKKKKINWAYKDERISEFSLTGDLLSEVIDVKMEYIYSTPFGIEYRFDIALLGTKLSKEPILLGVIEIEKENRFGLLKCLLCKSLGFPLISINVENLQIEDINENWCEQSIKETTISSEDGLRRNYIYIHNFLYTLYTNIPQDIRKDDKHQYIIFSSNTDYEKLYEYLVKYKKLLAFNDDKIIHIHKVKLNTNEISSVSMFKNEGSIAGVDWQSYNEDKYIRITLDIPFDKKGNLYLYHIIMARLFNSHFQTLIGYKYAKGVYNEFPDKPCWEKKGNMLEETISIIPKHY